MEQRIWTRAGFSLLEVLAVIVVLALLASVVAVSLASRWRQVRMQDLVERMITFDRQGRQMAVRFNQPMVLRFDLYEGTIRRLEAESGREMEVSPLRLGGGWRLREVRIGTHRQEYGTVEVTVSSRGYSASHALLLTGPQDERQWLLFPGLGGKAMTVDDEDQIEAIFEWLAGSAGGSGRDAG
jgi:prepilin-type N-terminal cleavage/methylation domain-containing protein